MSEPNPPQKPLNLIEAIESLTPQLTSGTPRYRPVADCFEPCEVCRPAHLLYEDFLAERADMPKFMLYLYFQENFAHRFGKAASGDTGYKIRFVPKETV